MAFTTIIRPEELLPNLHHPDWAIFDCRFSLADTENGRRDYLHAHIPGAVYTHLDEALCGPIIKGKTGRHPLPAPEEIVKLFSHWGIDSEVQVVAYDDASGSMAAARLWWLLRWLGHTTVAVLDGGFQRWQKAGLPVHSGDEKRAPRAFQPHIRPELLVQTEALEKMIEDPDYRILDVRAGERYRGESEPIDPVAGHIPGALSANYLENLDSEGNFLSQEALRKQYRTLLEEIPAEHAIFYCGSGVTAAQALLALAYAGLGDGKLYAGSWSEWITDPDRPVKIGASP